MTIEWDNLSRIPTQDFRCALCDRDVGADRGWKGTTYAWVGGSQMESLYHVAICPRCTHPTFVWEGGQYPAAFEGEAVNDLPEDVAQIYAECRAALSHQAPTGAVLLARKLLMHVAVSRGAREDENFKYYVDYLADSGIVTADMKDWVNEIRELGNDATHELIAMSIEEAAELLTFVALLLQIVYEYPAKAQRRMAARQARTE